jgi:Mu-like prophage I protein
MHFTPAEIRLIALHARLARPLHETVRALAEALPEASPRRILELAQFALEPDDAALNDAVASDDASDDDRHVDDDAIADNATATDAPASAESAEAMAARHADELARCASDDERADCESRQAAERAALEHQTARTSVRPARPPRDAAFRARMARDPLVLGLNRAIAELRGQRTAEKALARVDAAIAAGKLIPAQREWAMAYCAADAAGFNRFVDGQPALALAAAGTPGGLASPARHAHEATALSEDEARICSLTRTDPQKFLARRAQAHAAMAAQPAAGAIIRLELD